VTTLVVLPSYNERENIVRLIEALLEMPSVFVCVVDDNSPDGTGQLLAREIEARGWGGRVELLHRSEKSGRGGAVRHGLAWGLAGGRGFDSYVEMDCDFSHRPDALGEGLRLLREGSDVALGVRYPDGVIIDWPLRRRVFSRLANLMARSLIDWSIRDYTNGFRFYKPEAAQLLVDSPQRHTGYVYLSESLSLLLRHGFEIGVFPIVFRNRIRGASNTRLGEIMSAFFGVLAIGFRHRFRRR
jgi:dolichol-phosphate mannosyltransferase